MAVSERLKTFLDGAKVKYTVTKHPVVYTAQEIAAAQHVPGRQLAKCVLVKTDRGPALAVLPAVHLIDLKKLTAVLRAKTVTIAKEPDIKQAFPDVEVGAMSPFGNLYQVPVVVDQDLGQDDRVVFNAGSHTETISLRYRDLVALSKPKVGGFGRPIGRVPRPKQAVSRRAARVKANAGRAKKAARASAKRGAARQR